MAGHVVKVSVVAETEKFSRAFRGLAHETGLTSLAQTARTAAATLAKVGGAATLALGGLAAKGVSAAADLEQSTGAVEAVFKHTADQVKDFASRSATAVGLTKNEYQELATTIGSQLKNGGTSIDELAGKTDELIGLGADMSAMFGGTTADAVAALSSALKGERDPIERYGVTLKQAMIDAKAAALGFTDTSSSAAQQAATLALIMEQTADAHGAFAREGDTLSHQIQVLKANFGDFTADMGTLFLPAVTKAASWLNEHFTPAAAALKTWITDRLVPAVKDLAARFQADLLPRLKEAATAFKNEVLPVLKEVIAWIKTNGPPAIKAFIAVLRDWGPTILAAAATLKVFYEGFQLVQRIIRIVKLLRTAFQALNLALSANPIMLIVLAVAALAAGLVYAYQHCENFRTAVQTAWAAIKDAAAPVVEWFTTTVIPGLRALWDGLVEVVRAGWELIQAYWEQYGRPVAEFIISVFQGVADQWHTIWNGIQTYWQSLWNVLYAVVSTILGVIHGVITTVTGLITGDWHQAWDGVREIFSSVWEGIKGIVSGALEMIRGWLTAAWGVIKGAASGAWNALKDTVRDTWESVKTNVRTGVDTMINFVKSVPTKIKNLFSDAGHWLVDAGKRVIRGFIDGLKSMWGSVKSTLSRLTDWIPTWKGPAARDAGLLRGAGRAIIGGLVAGLEDRYSNVRASLASLTGMIAGTDLGSLDLPTTTLTGTGTTTTAPVTVNITIQGGLDSGPEIGRRVEQALTSWWAIRGRRPSVTWGMA